jgi:hypothetical protein
MLLEDAGGTRMDDVDRDDVDRDDVDRDDVVRDELSVDGSLAVIDAEGQRVSRRVTFNQAIISGAWAIAWFVGFGCAWLAYGPGRHIPGPLGPTVPAVLIAAAMIISIVYSARIGSGIVGPSRTSTMMYGWSWTLSFVCLTAVNITLGRQHMSAATVTLLWSASTLLLAGALYLAGGAIWRSSMMYVTGVWTMVCATGAVLAGVPGNFLVLSLAGGGGFGVLAIYTAIRRRS